MADKAKDLASGPNQLVKALWRGRIEAEARTAAVKLKPWTYQ